MLETMENEIEAFFENQKKVILKEIDTAKKEILICMAWFNDMDYLNALILAKENGVKVELITSNKARINILQFKDKFDYVGIAFLPNYFGVLHNKYCIIDNNIVLTGSYNWTKNAEYCNFENLLKIHNISIANDFKFDFIETKIFCNNSFIRPKRCNCSGLLINLLCIESEDINLQGECSIYTICSKCGEYKYITNDYEFNILNTLDSDNLNYEWILKFLNYHAEHNFDIKIHAIAVASINSMTLEKEYRVIYKNKFFKRFIEDSYDF